MPRIFNEDDRYNPNHFVTITQTFKNITTTTKKNHLKSYQLIENKGLRQQRIKEEVSET